MSVTTPPGISPEDPLARREGWAALADRILTRAAADGSPLHARVVPPTTSPDRAAISDVDQLEGFARTFLLAALRLAQPDADATAQDAHAAWFLAGIAAGVDPASPEAWPPIEHHGQTMVEAAVIALGLHASRAATWDRLPARVQEQVVAWFSTGRGRRCADNNHVLLGATVQAFLASVGADHDRTETEYALATLERWYRGDGWYTDGEGRRFDHYNAFTFHFYPWFIDDMLGVRDRQQVWRGRLASFLGGYASLMGRDGRPVLQGRSLAYRWGVLGPFWLGAALDASPLSPGRTRALAASQVRAFLDAGVAADGRLSLGWRGGESASLLQQYSMAGSPHWASKGFLGLLWPDSHPLWSDPLDAPPVRDLTPLAVPGFLTHRAAGPTVLLNHGSDGHPRHDEPWYRRLAFSDATVPVEVGGVRDNSVVPLGGAWSDRGLRGGLTGPDWACSHRVGRVGGREVHLDLLSVVRGEHELRLARVRGAGERTVRVSGFAVTGDTAPTVATHGGTASCALPGLVSELTHLDLGAGPVAAEVGLAEVETALGTHTAVPYLDVPLTGDGDVVAALVRLGDAPGTPVEAPAVQAGDEGVVVTWGDLVRVVPWPPTDAWPGDALDQGVWQPWRSAGVLPVSRDGVRA
ncbi:DUF2264 domain-containing protein [Propioniciclava coleopterorum]|uniref:DUF2264 domain-containing protein n=1 Tax=Propioniciclava coleopterorum TaxID=2714937 RepID=A0A6G7YA89_9ACTN|nr:DUF2264 domain-containing protein [Propioniciclava coleopterorum]QIK73713.1 DUF2264 domain-containing protein [Propioniciclava coleopterorum]